MKHKCDMCPRCRFREWVIQPLKGFTYGWFLAWRDAHRTSGCRGLWQNASLAWLYWKCWYWPMYVINGYEIEACRHRDGFDADEYDAKCKSLSKSGGGQ